ncbi:MAG: chromate transporter [Coriobacteriales bacterium]|nr:chromate transporter [Coriobacteriales bacterium]
MSLGLILQIILSFMKIGALSFGGGYAAVPLVEREVVEIQGWMSYAEFGNLMAIDEVTPGPIIINCATFVGMRVAGVVGAIAATVACIIPPCIVSLCLVLAYRKFKHLRAMNEVIDALKCMACGLIASTLVRFFLNLVMPAGLLSQPDLLALSVCAGAFVVMRKTQLNPILVLFCCGAVVLGLHLAFGL